MSDVMWVPRWLIYSVYLTGILSHRIIPLCWFLLRLRVREGGWQSMVKLAHDIRVRSV